MPAGDSTLSPGVADGGRSLVELARELLREAEPSVRIPRGDCCGSPTGEGVTPLLAGRTFCTTLGAGTANVRFVMFGPLLGSVGRDRGVSVPVRSPVR